ncbi:MAG: DUF4190 domain-containing protein [Lachnospiraceae bacterium]|nr:DUF4190 domain-containing protein [Lachnospiraceae bacterium]MBP3506782.1 DUF4190 domain-containing protein [Lachnospiraceae bacterium]
MGKKPQSVKLSQRVNPYQGKAQEQLKKVEKQAFVACVASIAGFPLSLLGVGMIMGIVGLVLGWKAKRPNGTRPAGAIVAIVFGIISIILSIPGWIVIYGLYINPGSQFVQNLVNALMNSSNLIALF